MFNCFDSCFDSGSDLLEDSYKTGPMYDSIKIICGTCDNDVLFEKFGLGYSEICSLYYNFIKLEIHPKPYKIYYKKIKDVLILNNINKIISKYNNELKPSNVSVKSLQKWKIVGITGKMGSGKDTLTKCFSDSPVIHFADVLKDSLQVLFGFTEHQLHTIKGKENIDSHYHRSPRYCLQKIGTDFWRNVINKDIFTMRNKERIEKIIYNPSIYCKSFSVLGYNILWLPDVRFENESSLVHSMKGIVIKIERYNDNVYNASYDTKNHESEKSILSYDFIISNDGTIEEFHNKCIALLINVFKK